MGITGDCVWYVRHDWQRFIQFACLQNAEWATRLQGRLLTTKQHQGCLDSSQPSPTTSPPVSTLWGANLPIHWASTRKLRFPLVDIWENWVIIFLQVLDKKRLCELVKEVDPAEQLDEDVEDVLLQVFEQILSEKLFQQIFRSLTTSSSTQWVRLVRLPSTEKRTILMSGMFRWLCSD